MREVVITGAAGNIGRILVEELSKEFAFRLLDIRDLGFRSSHQVVVPQQIDATNFEALQKAVVGAGAIIHLAWNCKEENHRSVTTFAPNKVMAENVLRAAVAQKIRRVILPSSIHADDFTRGVEPGASLTTARMPTPRNLYGASKVYVESLARYYAANHEVEIVCPRLGGVHPENAIRTEPNYRQIMLSRRDCANLFRACLVAPKIPGRFCTFYAVSNNKDRIHDVANPLGWESKDDCSKF